jgi:hypothetical protein
MMPNHSAENVAELAARLRRAVDLAQSEYERYRSTIGAEPGVVRAAVA